MIVRILSTPKFIAAFLFTLSLNGFMNPAGAGTDDTSGGGQSFWDSHWIQQTSELDPPCVDLLEPEAEPDPNLIDPLLIWEACQSCSETDENDSEFNPCWQCLDPHLLFFAESPTLDQTFEETPSSSSSRSISDSIEIQEPEKPVNRKRILKKRKSTSKMRKLFRCSYSKCSSLFDAAEGLRRHERTHTGDRPFTCASKGCANSCSEKGNLTKHRKRAHPLEHPYQCEFKECNQTFTGCAELRNHRKTHIQ